jgi:hypothetical protein
MLLKKFDYRSNIDGVEIGCNGRYIEEWKKYEIKYYMSDNGGHRVLKEYHTNIKTYPSDG